MKRNKTLNKLQKKDGKRKSGKKKSNYERKHEYLSRNGLWGFEVSNPKPWKWFFNLSHRSYKPRTYSSEW